MPKLLARWRGARTTAVFVGLSTALAGAWAQQQHAHTHGHMTLDVAIDAQTITLVMDSPLDGFLGFERAPRTEAERQRVNEMVARLNAAGELFQPDPAAGCKLTSVDLQSAVLGLGHADRGEEKSKDAHEHGHDHRHDAGPDTGHDHAHAHAHDHGDGHADIAASIVFNCDKAEQARFIDLKLFGLYPRIHTVAAQVASPQGQFKQTLKPANARLKLLP